MEGLALFGVTGRMGQSVLRALREGSALRLSGAIASPQSRRLAEDAAAEGVATGISITADRGLGLKDAAVAIDFSLPGGVAANAAACAAARVPLLVGSTGFDATVRASLERCATLIPVLIAPNTSVGVTVVAKLLELATRVLGASYDVEISEAHHRLKRDAPSGTALSLGSVVAGARGQALEDVAVFARHGGEPRQAGEIGFSVLRAGDIVGEHTVLFAGAGERVEITHRATDRITFARGALRAAEWLVGRPAGLYTMNHVLGLDQP